MDIIVCLSTLTMSQFDQVGSADNNLGGTLTAGDSIENDLNDCPSIENANNDDSSKNLPSSGPLTTSGESDNCLSDIKLTEQTFDPIKLDSGALSAPFVESPAKNLGLDPNLLHVFVFSDDGKPIFTR